MHEVPLIGKLGFSGNGDKLVIKDPVDQIVLILEMIVEALPMHLTHLTDVGYTDFFKGLILHKLFQCSG